MLGRGRGGPGGGRGARLAETLEKLKSVKLAGESSSESASEKSDTSASTESSPGEAEAPAPRKSAIGGRGKLRQWVQQKKEASSSQTSSSAETSPSSGSPIEGAVGGEPASPSTSAPQPGREAFGPPIVDKQRGSDGRQMDVAVNYIRLKRKEDTSIYEYAVFFDPPIDAIKLRRFLFRNPEVQEVIGPIYEFTGMNVFLPIRLTEDEYEIQTRSSHNNMDVTMTLKYIKQPPPEEMVPFFNTMFRRIMRQLRLVQINRHYYDPNAKIEIPAHKLEVWPGVVTSILDFDGGLMLNCDISHRVLRTSTALHVLKDILTQPDGRQRFEELAKKRLEGCIVLTRYNNKPYKIDEVRFDITPRSEFTLANGQKVTYLEYFKRHWNLEIRDANQPMLVHQPKKKGQPDGSMICLVPELSFMTGLTDDIRSDFRVMRDLAQHTRIKPSVRNQKLIEFVRNVNTNEESRKTLDDWGFELEGTTLKTTARQIAPEQMFFGNNKQITVNPKAEWANDARNSTLLQAVPVQRWVMIFTRRDAGKADEFVRCLQQVSRNMGFEFANPRKVEVMDDSPLSYCNAIKNSTSGAQLVAIMTPGSSQREDRYGAIKRLCYGELGMSCQVVREKTLQGAKMRAVCQNIALQITCKLGGQLWGIKIPFQSCMIVGMDVYHDPMIKQKSVIGMVASMNQGATKWYTRVYNQGQHQEVASTLQTGFLACLKKFYETSNSLPQRIFVFRDGVGDGDLKTVRDFEIVQMENALTDILKTHKGPRPLLSVVIVQKRINLKMFMRNRQTNDLDNPPPGSIIDHTVTRRIFYDFYLISQHVSQGTVTPSHYITLYDKNEMTPDRMQKITYKMTHLYYNFPSTIRVPAPCQYAHKAAAMVGQYVKKAPVEGLCDKLFFL